MNRGTNIEIEKYLSQVDHYLRYMPVTEKTDILSELKNSFYERMRNGQTEEAIIAEMESPKALAMSYVGDSIIKDKKFSFKRFLSVFGFYSVASLAWISIIPTLAALSISFFFSAGVSVLAGVIGLLKGVVHIDLIENLKLVFFAYELKGLPALLVGLVMAIIFTALGVICWKGTAKVIQALKTAKWKLNHTL